MLTSTLADLCPLKRCGVQDYGVGQRIPVQVSSLQSVQGILPVDPYGPNLPFCRYDSSPLSFARVAFELHLLS